MVRADGGPQRSPSAILLLQGSFPVKWLQVFGAAVDLYRSATPLPDWSSEEAIASWIKDQLADPAAHLIVTVIGAIKAGESPDVAMRALASVKEGDQ